MSKNRQRRESAFNAGYKLGRYGRDVGQPKARWLHGAWRAGCRRGEDERRTAAGSRFGFAFGPRGRLKSNFKTAS